MQGVYLLELFPAKRNINIDFSASSPTAGSHYTSLSLVAASCPQHLKGRSFLKQRRGRSCCPALAANGAMKGTVILSHPFVLLGEVHQTTGISKRQGKAVSNRCHPPPSSCSVPCCYPVYKCRRSLAPKNPPQNMDAAVLSVDWDIQPPVFFLHIPHTPMVPPSRQRLLAMPPRDHGRNHPVPSHREEKIQDNLQDRSTT